MSKFTPGPWRIGKGTSVVCNTKIKGGDNTGHNDEIGKDFYGGYMICESVLNEADKNLIAAAPDMYEALKKALLFIKNGRELGYIQMPDVLDDTAWETPNIIQKALLKAEGREK